MNSNDEEEVTVDNISSQHRGSKSFIEQMNKIESAEQMFESETEKQDE